jgi:hypothetical protein
MPVERTGNTAPDLVERGFGLGIEIHVGPHHWTLFGAATADKRLTAST